MNQDDPKTWKVGDVVLCKQWNGQYFQAGQTYSLTERHGDSFLCDNNRMIVPTLANQFKLVRRANAEGSGECQSRSHMPDSAGATPAPSANTFNCEMCEESFDKAWNHKGKLYCGGCHELILATTPKVHVIEQKPVCMCCSAFYGYDVHLGGSHPEEKCQATHLEALMPPLQRAYFRIGLANKMMAETDAKIRAQDAQLLQNVEGWMGRNPHMRGEHPNVLNYARLTGHNFKDD